MPPNEVHGVRFVEENARAVTIMAIAGFAIMYVAGPDELDDPFLRKLFLDQIRGLREGIPRERAFLVLEALNELHPDRDTLRQLVAEMRARQ